MVQYNRTLKEFIKLIVESKIKDAHLSDGRVVEWGADEHISELLEQIAEIQRRKTRHSRGSAARADYAKVEARLRAELKSAQKHAGRRDKNVITEKE